jgi:hypothetical protein
VPLVLVVFSVSFVFLVFSVPVVSSCPSSGSQRQQVERYRAFLSAAMSLSYFARITSHR